MGWYVPTGVSGDWQWQDQAIDNNTGTRAYKSVPGHTWSSWITVSRSALECRKIRFWTLTYMNGLTQVEVYRNGGWVLIFNSTANHNTWTYVSFTPGSVTQARFRQYNNLGEADNANLYELHFECVTPTAPSGCTAHYKATNYAYATWNDNSNNETNFRIEKAIDGAGFSFWKNVGKNVTNSGNYNVGANHRIKFRVRAYNQAGSSGYSASGYVYTTPQAPSGCTAYYKATNLAYCTWADNSAYEEGFRIEYSTNSGIDWALFENVGANVQQSSDKDVSGLEKIRFRVRAYIGGLYSTWSESSDLYLIPAAPSECTAHYKATNLAYCTWADNSTNETGFRVEYSLDGGDTWDFLENTVADVTQSSDYNAGENKKVRFRVRAYSAAGDSDWSTSEDIYTTPAAPSGCSISFGTINVGWNDNSAHEDGFKIERNLDDAGWIEVQTVGQDITSWADTSQPTGANEKYQYQVRAYKGTLYSAYSTSIAILWAKTFSESIGLTDSFSKVWSIYRTFTESIGLSDAYSRVLSLYRTFAESITLSDTLIKIRGKVFSEVISLSDSLIKKPGKVSTEQINLSDSLIKKPKKIVSESLSLSDSIFKRVSKILSETITLTDTWSRMITWYKTFTETLALADTLRKKTGKTFTESLTIADFLIKEVTRQRANFLQALNADAMFPSGVVRNLQHGLDTDKSTSPGRGDWYIATNTQKVYVCFTDGSWVQIYP